MSLIIHNQASDKQLQWLREHDYCGTMTLTHEEAAKIIDELIEEERITIPRDHRDYFKMIKRING